VADGPEEVDRGVSLARSRRPRRPGRRRRQRSG
jgi:hypothetical protein